MKSIKTQNRSFLLVVRAIALTLCLSTHRAISVESIALSSQEIPILDGQALTVTDLYHLKNNPDKLIKDLKNKLLQNKFTKPADKQACRKSLERLEFLKTQIEPYVFWWQKLPTIGLRLEDPFWPLQYPYMPHAFALWELAPTMGKNIDVFLVDTGIAAFTLDLKNYYKKHQDLQMLVDFSQEKYNFTFHEQDILDPFEQLLEMFLKYTNSFNDNEEYLRSHLPGWIRNYLQHDSTTDISDYLFTYGKPDLWEKIGNKKKLTEEGNRALREIVRGELGFKSKHLTQKNNFTMVDLQNPNNQKNVIMEFLPIAPIFTQDVPTIANDIKENDFFVASYESGHGSHSAGLVGALLHSYEDHAFAVTKSHIRQWLQRDSGICGIAPSCHTVMVKGLRSDGSINSRSVVIKSIKQAHRLGAQILNLSLKIDDQLDPTEPDSIALEKVLEKIPYVVACSGNATEKKDGTYKANVESYPAKFACVPFDVGAFSWRKDDKGNYSCPVLETSQYQKNVGPKFIMPGQNILSCGLVPNQTESSMYVFMQGTSTSAPLISGFLGLLLGEFKGTFEKKHERSIFLKVCYTSAIKMHDTQDWNTQCLLGTLDMRTALFVAHVLRLIKDEMAKNKKLKKTYNFYDMQDYFIASIHAVLEYDIINFSEKHAISSSFKNNFLGFFNTVHTLHNTSDSTLDVSYKKQKRFVSLESAITYVKDTILYVLDDKTFKKPDIYIAQVNTILKKIFEQKEINIFKKYTHTTQSRLALTL